MGLFTSALLLMAFLVSCQIGPTRVREQAVNVDLKNTVIVDTRSALDYASFHFSGSVSLQSADYLILKPGLAQKRIFDPDLAQTIERLARRGLHPERKVIVISNDTDQQNEAKKWQWLLRRLGLTEVTIESFSALRNRLGGRPPQAQPERMPVWTVADENKIRQQAEFCFVNWDESLCAVR